MNALSDMDLSNLPSTKKGERIYAIGDIHGRYDLMKLLIGMIDEHAAAQPKKRPAHIIVLGDMIDRGPDSDKVLRSLRHRAKKGGMTVLLGNHEEILLRAIDGEPGVMKAWMRFGGIQTLQSFGIEVPTEDFDQPELVRQIKQAIPESWIEWLRGLPISARSGDYFFCHAGLRPGIELNRQSRKDMLWIREEFLESDNAHGVVVVHGHSISPDVELRHNRIGVDTGAYRTGMLTAAYLEDRHCGILSTGNSPVPEQLSESLTIK
ncbi:MAG TPA: metallophosphoesterase family protein [Sphingobium sp.]|uniref:metallophosphoesterase family protein n=1 Tax=Sphingobium sp. TaxID=1912891 RepID=UPI002ED57143